MFAAIRRVKPCKLVMQAGEEAKVRFASLPDRRQPSVGRTQRRLQSGIDTALATRHIATVGPHCSRPAYPRHIAQALQLTRSPGRGFLAICLISTKSFVW